MKHSFRFIFLILLCTIFVAVSDNTIAATPEVCNTPNVGGTAELPAACPFIAPDDLMYIIDGLPSGTTIKCVPRFGEFWAITRTPGGLLGGELEQFTATLTLKMTGTGSLGGTFTSTLPVHPLVSLAVGPRIPGMSPQILPQGCVEREK